MNVIWRFYMDSGSRWNWSRSVPVRKPWRWLSKGYANYEACLANAKDRGYIYLPAQSKQAPGR